MKIHLFYLRSDGNRLYAYTSNDEYAQQFIEMRNMNVFYYKTEKMDKYVAMAFMNKNKDLMLIKIPLEDKDGQYEIIGTYEEDRTIEEAVDHLSSQMEYFESNILKNVPFNDEYKELIEKLTTYYHDENNHPIIDIDGIALFYELFRNTFLESEKIDFLKNINEKEKRQ